MPLYKMTQVILDTSLIRDLSIGNSNNSMHREFKVSNRDNFRIPNNYNMLSCKFNRSIYVFQTLFSWSVKYLNKKVTDIKYDESGSELHVVGSFFANVFIAVNSLININMTTNFSTNCFINKKVTLY